MSEYDIESIVKKPSLNKKFTTEIEQPDEILTPILGLRLTEFYINTGKEDAYCNEIEEIHMEFQGKEMKIFINEDGHLQVYTD